MPQHQRTSDVATFDWAERVAWLRLARSENVGPITFGDLLSIYGSARHALAAVPELARRGGRRRAIKLADEDRALAEMDAVERVGGRMLLKDDPGYPPRLAAIADAPPLITALGEPSLLTRPTIAMVGARNASAAGRRFAHDLAKELGSAQLVVVSGLARGIDTHTHQGALATGTVAVVAGGANNIYPPENETLYELIREQGAIVSEQPLGTVPQARHFPRRNRLISGLSLGVVVVEATSRSGSLITARFAADQGREVFAVPGTPTDPRHRGTNRLIREGAILTESAQDIIDNLQFPMKMPEIQGQSCGNGPFVREICDPSDVTDNVRRQVIDLLGPSPVSVDELVRQCQVTPAELWPVLLELELAGRLSRLEGGNISLSL